MKMNCDLCGRPVLVNRFAHLLNASEETQYLCPPCYRTEFKKWEGEIAESLLERCEKCGGVGKILEYRCEKCKGTGKQKKGLLFCLRTSLFSRFEGVKKVKEA